MRAHFDVIVVGAGPAGAAAAREAARAGCGSVLLLERSTFPRQKTCAGGLSPKACNALRRLGLLTPVARAANVIRGSRITTPDGEQVTLNADAPGLVLDRRRLDQVLVHAAIGEGACFWPGVPMRSLLTEAGRVVGVRTSEADVTAAWVILAGGAAMRLPQDRRPRHAIQGCVARFEGARCSPHLLEIVYDRELVPYYAWLFPEPDGRVNVGIGVDGCRGKPPVRELFERVVERHFSRHLAGAEQVESPRSHPIYCVRLVSHRAPRGALLAGEANGLTSLASGEGIYYALLSGYLAARSIREGQRAGLSPGQTAGVYVGALRRAFGVRFAWAGLYHWLGGRLLGLAPRLAGSSLVRRFSLPLLSRM